MEELDITSADFDAMFENVDSLGTSQASIYDTRPLGKRDIRSYTVSSGKGKVKRQRKSNGGGKFYTAPGREPRLPPRGHPPEVRAFFEEYNTFFTTMVAKLMVEMKTAGDNQKTVSDLMRFIETDRQQFYRRSEVVVNGRRVRTAQAEIPPLPSKEAGGGTNFWTATSTVSKRITKAKKANEVEVVKLRGITDVIHETFCGGSGGRWFSRVKARTNMAGSFRSSCGLVGHKHGTRVHDQIDKITKALRSNTGRSVLDFLDGYTKPIDPCTIAVFRLLRETRRIPMATEHVVYDEYLRIHTPIDLICLEFRQDGKILSNMVEVKTGFDGPFLNHVDGDKYMSRSMDGTWLTPYQLAVLQILITMIICVSRYEYCPSQALILHIPKQGNHEPEFHSLPLWCHDKEKRDLIVQDLVETLPKVGRKWLDQFTDLVQAKIIKGYK